MLTVFVNESRGSYGSRVPCACAGDRGQRSDREAMRRPSLPWGMTCEWLLCFVRVQRRFSLKSHVWLIKPYEIVLQNCAFKMYIQRLILGPVDHSDKQCFPRGLLTGWAPGTSTGRSVGHTSVLPCLPAPPAASCPRPPAASPFSPLPLPAQVLLGRGRSALGPGAAAAQGADRKLPPS